MGLLGNGQLDVLLDAGFRRHKVIASNLANVDTPGYRGARLRFDDELSSVLERAEAAAADGEPETEVYRPGGRQGPNNVSLEQETVRLSQNSLRVQQYLSILNFRIRRMKTALRPR